MDGYLAFVTLRIGDKQEEYDRSKELHGELDAIKHMIWAVRDLRQRGYTDFNGSVIKAKYKQQPFDSSKVICYMNVKADKSIGYSIRLTNGSFKTVGKRYFENWIYNKQPSESLPIPDTKPHAKATYSDPMQEAINNFSLF